MDSRITKKQSKVLLDVMKKALLIRDMADKLTEKAVAAGRLRLCK